MKKMYCRLLAVVMTVCLLSATLPMMANAFDATGSICELIDFSEENVLAGFTLSNNGRVDSGNNVKTSVSIANVDGDDVLAVQTGRSGTTATQTEAKKVFSKTLAKDVGVRVAVNFMTPSDNTGVMRISLGDCNDGGWSAKYIYNPVELNGNKLYFFGSHVVTINKDAWYNAEIIISSDKYYHELIITDKNNGNTVYAGCKYMDTKNPFVTTSTNEYLYVGLNNTFTNGDNGMATTDDVIYFDNLSIESADGYFTEYKGHLEVNKTFDDVTETSYTGKSTLKGSADTKDFTISSFAGGTIVESGVSLDSENPDNQTLKLTSQSTAEGTDQYTWNFPARTAANTLVKFKVGIENLVKGKYAKVFFGTSTITGGSKVNSNLLQFNATADTSGYMNICGKQFNDLKYQNGDMVDVEAFAAYADGTTKVIFVVTDKNGNVFYNSQNLAGYLNQMIINVPTKSGINTALYFDDFSVTTPDEYDLVSVTPADAAASIAARPNAIAEYESWIDPDNAQYSATITKIGESAPVEAEIVIDGKTISVTPKSDLDVITDYKFEVSGLTDLFGRELPAVESTFTTGRLIELGDYSLNGVVGATKLANGANKVIVSCASGDSTAHDVILIAAVYNADKTKLLGVTFAEETLPATNEEIDIEITDVLGDVDYGDAGVVSVMLWKSIDEIIPYMVSVELTK